MKTQFVMTCLVMWSITGWSQAEKAVKSKIDHVTVFLQGAQVYRSSPVNLPAGTTKVIFNNLEANIDMKSLQASGRGDFVILDVTHVSRYPEPPVVEPSKVLPKNLKLIKALRDSIRSLEFDREDIVNKRQVLETEKSTLLGNRIMKAEFKKDSVALVKDALEYLRSRLNNINGEMMKLKRQDAKLSELHTEMKGRLTALENFNTNPGSPVQGDGRPDEQVVVTLSATSPVTGTLEVNYFLPDAGWRPSYDLRASSAENSMQLTYKANVFQNTGHDWQSVQLKLSTADPSQANDQPVLSPWYLDYLVAQGPRDDFDMSRQRSVMPEAKMAATAAPAKEKEIVEEIKAETAASYTTFVETATNFEFDIRLAYTIPSDNVPHLVAIKNEDVPAGFRHYAAPKLSTDAFLVARVTGWEDLNLIPGNANIYLDGAFISESFIDPASTGDTLSVTLGRDKGIVITRINKKDKVKDKFVNDDRIQTITYEITLKNTKSKSATINVSDQIPVSGNKGIVVDAIALDGATFNKETGLLDWKVELKPKEIRKIQVTYSVKFVKDKMLTSKLM